MNSVLDPTVPIDVGVASQRARIIEAMLESCAEKTYAGTTIADIVSRASISRTTFYKRFAGKRECFDATLDWCVERLTTAIRESHAAGDAPAEAVRKGAAAMLELMAVQPALAQLAMGEAAAVDPDVIQRYRKLLVPALEGLWDAAGEPRRGSGDVAVSFGQAQILVFNQVVAGRTAQLPELLPELVYIALLPFAGHDEALKQARIAGNDDQPKRR